MIHKDAKNVAPNGPTVLEFGSGDIITNTLRPGDGSEYPFGISCRNTDRPTPPGTDRPEFDSKKLEDFDPEVVLTFTSVASFDSVISRLQLAKEAYIDHLRDQGTKDLMRSAWHASGRKTVSFHPYDLDYENRCFEQWWQARKTKPTNPPEDEQTH